MYCILVKKSIGEFQFKTSKIPNWRKNMTDKWSFGAIAVGKVDFGWNSLVDVKAKW
jgi:hypothetical protein